MRIFLGMWLFAAILLADAHIFVYHRFGDDRYPSTDTSIAILKKQFSYFKSHGFVVVPLSKLVHALKHHLPIPDNWVILTIDDSFKSFYKNGLPLFKEYKYPFTLFVYTKATDEGYGDYMSWDQVKDTMKYGDIGFHSYAHPHMVSLGSNALKSDFEKGLKLVKKHLGLRPKYFAYPYGEYDPSVQKIAMSFGFEAICNQNVGAINKDSNIFDLDRIALTGNPNLKEKLHIRHLSAKWIMPKVWPKNGIVKQVKIKISDNAKRGWLYLSGYGWHLVKIDNKIVNVSPNLKLKKRRSRLILKLKEDKISTKILIKGADHAIK